MFISHERSRVPLHCIARSKLHKCLLVRRFSSLRRNAPEQSSLLTGTALSKRCANVFSSSSAFHSSVVKVHLLQKRNRLCFASFPLHVYHSSFFALCQGVFRDFFCASQNPSIRSFGRVDTRRQQVPTLLDGVSKPESRRKVPRGHINVTQRASQQEHPKVIVGIGVCSPVCHTAVCLSSSWEFCCQRRVDHDPQTVG